MANNKQSKRIKPARLSALILVVLGVIFVSSTGFYTDSLWFKQLGFSQVFFTQIATQTTLFIVAFAVMAIVVGVNLFVTNKLRPIYTRLGDNDPDRKSVV
mgnify:FL=1